MLSRKSELERIAQFTLVAAVASKLAVFFQAGVSPARAWEELARGWDQPSEAGEVSESIYQALLAGARHRTAVWESCEERGEAWRCLAAVVAVADESGAPIAEALWSLSETLRERVAIESDIAAMVQVPRQTTVLLLALPLVAIWMAGALGVNALAFLTGSTLGWISLLAAVGAIAVALRWMRRLTLSVLPQPGSLSPATDLLRVATSGGALPEVALARVHSVLEALDLLPKSTTSLSELVLVSRRAGIPLGTLAKSTAQWDRQALKAHAAEATAALSVRVLLPLGLLVLPAFVLVGVFPVVFTLLRGALSPTSGVVW